MNKRCIELDVAQGRLQSQRVPPGGRALVGILGLSLAMLGCPSGNSSSPSEPIEPSTPSEQALDTPVEMPPTTVSAPAPELAKITLPVIAITDEHVGARKLDVGEDPQLLATLDGVWLDGKQLLTLHCSPGDACPGFREEAGWARLRELPPDNRPSLLAVDTRVAADVLAALVEALTPGDTTNALIVKSDTGELHVLPLRSFPRDHGLLDPTSLSYRTTFFRGDLRSQRGTAHSDPPPAPGQPIHIRGGAIDVPTRCGGLRAGRLIRRNMGTWSACYRLAHQRVPGLAGDVQLQFDIPLDGIPTAVEARSSNLTDKALLRCLEAGIQEVKFPEQTSAGSPCRVTWDLNLTPRKANPGAPPDNGRKYIPLAVLVTPEGAHLRALHGVPAVQTGLNTGLGEALKQRIEIGEIVVLIASPSIPTGALSRGIAEGLRAGFKDIRIATPSVPRK